MSVISQLLLTQFWPNFKGRFLGLSWTDSNTVTFVHIWNISAATDLILTKLFRPYILGAKIFLDHNFFHQIFLDHNFVWPKLFWFQHLLWPNNFRTKTCFEPKFFSDHNFLDSKYFGSKFYTIIFLDLYSHPPTRESLFLNSSYTNKHTGA